MIPFFFFINLQSVAKWYVSVPRRNDSAIVIINKSILKYTLRIISARPAFFFLLQKYVMIFDYLSYVLLYGFEPLMIRFLTEE